MENITIEQIQKLVGDKYKVISYNGSRKPVILHCPIHGIFKKRIDHIRQEIDGELCQKCKKEEERINKFKEFERQGKEIHNGKYTYHIETFTKMSEPTIITCPIHGDFSQVAENHIWSKQGCKKCFDEQKLGKYKYSRDEIIEMCKKTHGDRYIYDDIVFQGMKNKMLNIKCPIHGYFDQVAYDHIKGFGCEKCKFENQFLTIDEFVKRANQTHNNKYSYDKTDLKNRDEKGRVIITCPIHGDFLQKPANHLLGIGCPYCQTSKLENEIEHLLTVNNIEFLRKYHADWLGRLELDFYLPQYNIAIECQGKQHFEQITHFDDNGDSFEIRIERDKRKLKLCQDNGVKLLYYSNLGIEYPYNVFEDKELLLKEIRGAA